MKKYKLLSILLILIFSLVISDFIQPASAQSKNVAAESLNVRSGPGLSYDIIGSLKQGDSLQILDTYNDWYKISYKGHDGWIASWLTESSTKSDGQDVIAQVDGLNFREAPSTDSTVLARLNSGDRARLIKNSNDWLQIEFNGTTGWVFSEYATIAETSDKKSKASEENITATFQVGVDALNVRKEANQSSKKVAVIYKNETYNIVKKDGNWLKIELNDKQQGWVYSFHGHVNNSSNPSESHSESGKTITVLTNGTNIRAEASTSSAIVQRADAGEQFSVKKQHGDWYEIHLSSGATAFIAEWVVSSGETTTAFEKKPTANRIAGTLNGLTIVVDAGHGGNDKGTIGARGTYEKTITLKTADLLANKLKAAGANVYLTRSTDSYVSLQNRVWSALQMDADAFISLHYDASLDSSINGFTTYYQHQNQRALTEKINDGLASTVNLKNRGVQPADFYVLRENPGNAVLIELGFLSNVLEEGAIVNHSFREQASYGIYKGILDYFNAQLD